NERFQTMGDVEEALNAWLDGRPIPMESKSADGTPAPAVGDTTTRLKAFRPSLSTPSQSSQSNPTVEKTTESVITDKTPAPLETTATDAQAQVGSRQDTTLKTGIMPNPLALIAASLLILLPIAYFVARQVEKPAQNPVDTTFIRSVEQGEKMPGSAAQQSKSDNESIDAGIRKFYDGQYQDALKIFSSIAYAKGPASQQGLLWQGLTEVEMFRFQTAKTDLQKYMQKSSDKGVDAARALNGLGFACSNLGQLDEAHGYFDRARMITEKLTGTDRVVHAQTLRGMAELALNKGAFKTAFLQLTAAQQIDQQLGAPELELAYVENDLGQTYGYMKQPDKARECYDTALTMRQNKLHPNSPLIAYSLRCIASIDYQQKKLAAAASRLKQVLSIDHAILTEDSLSEMQRGKMTADLGDTYLSLGAMNEYQRQYSDAASNYTNAAQALATVYGENDARVKAARSNAAKMSRHIGRSR
ncbi:MAG TPA: tetratricopeptide repeat protein, partial [Chroococcales cyanobacterium]